MSRSIGLVFVLMASLPALAQEPSPGAASDATAQKQAASAKQKEMEAWKKYGTPGEMHKMIGARAGTWNYTVKSWEENAPKPETSSGTSRFKTILGGRYLQQDMTGKMMGQTFHGIGLLGYDNLKQRFDSLWIDDMSTGVIHGTGTYDPAKKTITETGEYADPMTPGQMRKYKGEWVLTDRNTMTYTMTTQKPDGSSQRMMEVVYRRAGTQAPVRPAE